MSAEVLTCTAGEAQIVERFILAFATVDTERMTHKTTVFHLEKQKIEF